MYLTLSVDGEKNKTSGALTVRGGIEVNISDIPTFTHQLTYFRYQFRVFYYLLYLRNNRQATLDDHTLHARACGLTRLRVRSTCG